jgi:putative membrane protein
MWDGHMDGWWWLMIPTMLAFWALVIWGCVVLLRKNREDRDGSRAADVLAQRLARGEIDEAEYRRLRDVIRS